MNKTPKNYAHCVAKLIVYTKNNATQNRNLFQTTHSFKCRRDDCQDIFRQLQNEDYEITKAYWNNMPVTAPNPKKVVEINMDHENE